MADVGLDQGVPVLIAKIGSYPLHHGSVGAIRSFGRAGVPVYAIIECRYTPAGCSRWLNGCFIWPNSDLSIDRLLDGLLAIADRIGGRPLLLPTDDRMAVFVAEHSDQLRPKFRFPEQRSTVVRKVANKYELSQLCTELGVPSPRATVPEDRTDVLAFCDQAMFPVMAKVTDAAALSHANIRSTSIAATPTDLLALWERAEQHVHSKLMFQEFIPDGEDWIFHGYCDERSDAIAAYTGVKLRSAPPFAGATAMGRTQQNEVLVRSAQALFHKIGYRGIMDMDWRLDRRDGLYKLLDFNPRVGAQFRMFVNGQGVDVVRAMHLDMTGRHAPSGQPANGRGFMVENYDIVSALGGYRRAGLTLRQWYGSLQGVQELGWFSRDDLLPSVAVATYLAADIGRRAVRRGVRQVIHGTGRNVSKADPLSRVRNNLTIGKVARSDQAANQPRNGSFHG